MQVNSVALAATYSAVLSLLNIDTNGPVGFSLSVGQTTSDIFELYGTLDAAAVDNTNAQNLGQFTGGTANLPAHIAEQARTWPFVLIRRIGGSTAGFLFVAGNPAASPAVITAAAPVVVGNYSALMTLTTLGTGEIRIGGARQMLVTDVFDVFLSNDSALASSTGAFWGGRIYGGGGSQLNTVKVSGFNYAIIQRASASTTLTAGNIIAAGVSPNTGGGTLNLTDLAVGDTAVNGPIGALTNAQTVDIYSSFTLTQTTAGITAATLPNPTDTTRGKVALVKNNDTSGASLQMYGMTLNIGAVQVFQWDGTAWLGGFNITQGGNNFGNIVQIGSTDAQNLRIIRGGVVVLSDDGTTTTLGATAGARAVTIQVGTGAANIAANATDHPTTVGSVTVASLTTIQGGTSGVAITGTGAGPIVITGGTGTSSWSIGAAGTLNIGANATDHTCTFGSGTGVSTTTVQSGSGGVAINTGITTDRPTSIGGGVGSSAFTLQYGTGGASIGANAIDHTTTIGSVTGASSLILQAGTAGINAIATGAGPISLTPGATGAVIFPPRAAGAGNTTELRLLELAASGVNYTGFKAPDALAADLMYTLPTAFPTIASQVLASSTAGVATWRGATLVFATNTSGFSIPDAIGTNTTVTGWTTVTDTATAFVAATGVFTAPVTGNYNFDASFEITSIVSILNGEFRVAVAVNGVIVASAEEISQVAVTTCKRSPRIGVTVAMTAGQTAVIQLSQNSGSGAGTLTATAVRNYLSISLVP